VVEVSADNRHTTFAWLRQLIAISGKAVAWLTVIMVLLTFTIVILRYGFNLGWIWLQESLT
jgi:TRAP-type C4-dicarboxylate transport system permease small subunit